MSTTWINRGHLYAPHVTPVIVDCNFVVTPSNGLGITLLKGQGVSNVFMHTSTTPAAGPNGYLNPNPQNGVILVQLSDNFNRLYDVMPIITSPNSGSAVKIDNAALTPGVAYTITIVGDATLAQWQGVGLPKGLVPTVGQSFIATAAGGSGNTSTSRVQAPAAAGSTISTIEIVGDPNQTLWPVPQGGSPNVGGWIVLQTLAATDATTTTLVKTAPATGSVIRLGMYLGQSSVVVSGE